MAYQNPDDNDHSQKVYVVAMIIAAIAFILVSQLIAKKSNRDESVKETSSKIEMIESDSSRERQKLV